MNSSSRLPDYKQIQAIQSWYEPALRTLNNLLDVRKANLRKINRDEANAAVTRDELMEALHQHHRMSYGDASLVITSLHRADKILMFGRFIQLKDQVGES